ncbi:XXYS1_4_G0019800.mRNA.1.CDS.1 [Saccharomyces cerevisiae]|nr:EM14S01-3B_G0017270.mRNA.1.CDS.1 [Saccharomyces cerevisiae]CAD6649241.1 XXYS1_4_G0019800.mRNA.1.CDS.1 [Saccharomyces cerevisiae]CAI4816791.1 CEI_1a_G0052870.mRNA.1.CDS.1 [Saccharomyces cerevisiae]CAI4825158.1 AMH_1a_G0053000.mRNA.1.CDS.1 [Saccharomyces cerevisiae]CAI6897463.1 AMH_1a_G0053000.mRNA.1.CDS.1 [Saccharomyces cerevisiae]
MKFTPSIVIDAPQYYVDHFNGKYNVDKCVILRDLQLETDSESMPSSLKHLTKPTHILDLTNNDLIMIPDLSRRDDIHTLLLGRNNIVEVDGRQLPMNVQNLTLSNNSIRRFEDLQRLRRAPRTLKNLTLIGNQVCHLANYREHVLRLVPHLETLDFQNVTAEERKSAMSFPRQADGDTLGPVNTAIKDNGSRDKTMEIMNLVVSKMTVERRNELKKQLAEATSLEEIARLEKLLSGGV